ncbi:MAG: biopolymer transporter ExbD [Candidatus Riflebacteria bacterium]|nr:biopolymer transporter ExbD [Candidatus Riflebacteria bacterium]
MAASIQGSYEDEGGVIADINVTPLVDVTLVLLIIMMVTAPMLVEPTAIKVDLPKGKTGEATVARAQTRSLSVGKNGQIQLDGAMLSLDTLRSQLATEVVSNPNVEVGIAADKGAEYGQVIQALDAIRAAGVVRFSLQMEDDGAAEGMAKALASPLPPVGPAAVTPNVQASPVAQ